VGELLKRGRAFAVQVRDRRDAGSIGELRVQVFSIDARLMHDRTALSRRVAVASVTSTTTL
jgi:hypothetical protein